MKKIISLILCLFFALSCFGCIQLNTQKAPVYTDSAIKNAPFKVHFIDVGQGDCILVESSGHFALIDAGENADSYKAINYLGNLGVTSLDFTIATHPHSDHCGGFPNIFRNFSCGYFLFPETDVDTNTWYSILDAADERGVPCEGAKAGDVFALGDATVTVLSPKENSIYSNLNNYSIVCIAQYQNTSVLLMGDAEKLVEKELISESYDLCADVLKLGHHGSSSSSGKEFLRSVNPSVAIITCGKDNDYGHPHRETTDALEELGIPYRLTSKEGSIVVSSDGEKISVTSQSGSESLTESPTEMAEVTYIGNKNSHIFHRDSCESAVKTKEKNKVYFSSREEAVSKGYDPCKGCNP